MIVVIFQKGGLMWFVKIWQKLRLDVKVIGSTLSLLGIMTILLGWSAIAAEQRALQTQIQSQGASLAEAAAIFSIEPLLTLDDAILISYVKRLARTQYNIGFVRILNKDGRIVAQAPDFSDSILHASKSIHVFKVNVLVEPDDIEPIGVVEIGLLIRHADQEATTRVQWLIIASIAIFCILAMALSVLLKKIVTDPIRKLDQYAKTLGQGDLESIISLPGQDELGRLALALDVMRQDIREFHATLQRQEEYVASLIDSALDMIISIDQKQRIVLFNPAAVKTYGYTVEEIQGKPVKLLYTNANEAKQVLNIINETGKFLGEITCQRKDGSQFPVFLSASLLKDRKGLVIGVLGNSRDITEQKQLAELDQARKTAEAANQAKSSFLAIMSHEIRSPMNGVIGMADLLSATQLSTEQRQYVEIILRSSHSLLSLLNGILDFSKVEAGALKLENEIFNPHEMVIMACEIMTATAHSKGLKLIHEMDAKIPDCIQGDPLRLRQILLNLIGNAIKFTLEGEICIKMVLSTQKQNNDDTILLHFTVTDTGIGVPQDKQEIIFDRFSQADLSTTRKFGGVGLGLAISKQLVELMQGRMWLESQGENLGSAFHFLVCCKACQKTDHLINTPEKPMIQSTKKTKSLHILIVDDGLDNRILAAHILHKEGYTVEQAVNGVSALETLKKEPFDLVLMDVQMPEMDGIVATRIIREGGLGMHIAHIPILGISAGALQEEKDRGLTAGMDEFLTKPYRARALLDAVRRLTITARRRPVLQSCPSELLLPVVAKKQSIAMERLAKALATQDAQAVAESAKNLQNSVTTKSIQTLALQITLAAQKDHLNQAQKYFDRLQQRLLKLTNHNSLDNP